MKKLDKSSSAITRAQAILVIVVILVAGGAAAYFATLPGPTTTSTTAATTTTTPATTTTTAPTTTTTTAPPLKDTLVIGTTDSSECACFEPAKAYDYFGLNVAIENLGAGLVQFSPGTEASPPLLKPALATSWQISGDGLTYTFTLRSGVRYDDGTPFDSSAVKYHFDRAIGLADPDGAWVALGLLDILDSVDAPNPTTVVFHLKTAWAPFLSWMAFQVSYPVNPNRAPKDSIVTFVPGDPVKSNPNGLGPYKLTEWTRSGNVEQEMKLEANPNFWNYPNYPVTRRIIIKFFTDPTALAAAIRSGDVDIAYRQFTTSDIQSLQTVSGLKVLASPGAFIQYLVINQHVKPFDDVRVRQALAAAVDRTNLVKTVFLSTASELYSQIPIGMITHKDVFKTKYGVTNYALAKQLLAQLGYNETNRLVVDLWYESSGHYPQSPDQAQVLKSDLEKSGVIQVNLHGTDWGTYRVNRRQATMPVFFMGWYPDFIDPYDYTYPFFEASASSWLNYGYNSSKMQTLLNQALTATSQEQVLSLYGQIQDLQAEEVPIIPLYQGGVNCCGAVAKAGVGGIFLDVTLIFRIYTIFASA